ncbi:MAG TPA: NAD(P)H-hydrate dehydratase [Gemmatimonadaceae bacterium]|jgi:NAD(P)H-hydrate epimerase
MRDDWPRVLVVDSEQSAARDAAAIAGGVPSRALMQRAGAAMAGELMLRAPRRLAGGVRVFAGPGNNGGDAWVVARALAATGIAVRVVEAAPPKTPDAIAERALAVPFVTLDGPGSFGTSERSEGVTIDGLLGTGSSGTPRGAIADCVSAINEARTRGALVVAIDLPTGLDATTGEATHAVQADLTFTFGAVKRGHLVTRQACGTIVVLDIGLGAHASRKDGAPPIVDEAWVFRNVPPIAADAHKGTRKKLAIVGGAPGMAGASILAARAAMRSGIGMVRLVVAPESLAVVQAAEPFALAGSWPGDAKSLEREVLSWADGVVIGPGLGRSTESRALVERVLASWQGPVLLDADALNVFDGDADALARAVGQRQVLLTPHPAEFSRLASMKIEQVLSERFGVGAVFAKRLGATVLFKGTPTTISGPNGDRLVSAAGNPVLAAAGSGDILSGIAGTLLTQIGDALTAGAVGAWIHGRAAEIAVLPDKGRAPRSAPRTPRVRGFTLEDVLLALPSCWPRAAPLPRYPVLLELPAVGEGA